MTSAWEEEKGEWEGGVDGLARIDCIGATVARVTRLLQMHGSGRDSADPTCLVMAGYQQLYTVRLNTVL